VRGKRHYDNLLITDQGKTKKNPPNWWDIGLRKRKKAERKRDKGLRSGKREEGEGGTLAKTLRKGTK